jgi:hypothetical protein
VKAAEIRTIDCPGVGCTNDAARDGGLCPDCVKREEKRMADVLPTGVEWADPPPAPPRFACGTPFDLARPPGTPHPEPGTVGTRG